jgi:hypothetical protein
VSGAIDTGIGAQRARRSYWLKTLHQWHWISSAVCLVGLLLFTITGITLNHAAQIEATPDVTTRTAQLPASLLKVLSDAEADADGAPDASALPATVAAWIDEQLSVRVAGRAIEWSEGEIYVPLPRPGGDAWLSIDTIEGMVEYEHTDRGWISWLNDLHKGRNTGGAWRWFIDVFAVASLVFCITGLFLLQLHARQRAATWPVVGLGLLLPVLIILLFIH